MTTINKSVSQRERIEVRYLEDDQYLWYLGRSREELGKVCVAKTLDSGWFPTHLVAGIEGRRFSENTELSRRTGWLSGRGNKGSMTEFFRAEQFPETVRILEQNGYNVIVPYNPPTKPKRKRRKNIG